MSPAKKLILRRRRYVSVFYSPVDL